MAVSPGTEALEKSEPSIRLSTSSYVTGPRRCRTSASWSLDELQEEVPVEPPGSCNIEGAIG